MERTMLTPDSHPIDAIVWGDSLIRVGTAGVTKIVAYEEDFATDGMGIWFAIYMGERLRYRVNARLVTLVDYGLPEELRIPSKPKLVTSEG